MSARDVTPAKADEFLVAVRRVCTNTIGIAHSSKLRQQRSV
jgi:hypothetical protein